MKENRNRRKRFALWPAVMMAVMLAFAVVPVTVQATTPAPGTDSATDANKGSITISNPGKGVTYYAYKIFDVTYSTSGSTKSYSYTIPGDSEWFSTVKGFADTSGNALTLIKSAGGNIYVVSAAEGFSAAKFSSALKAALSGKTGTEIGKLADDAGEGATLKKESLALGYYLVVGKTGSGGDTATEALCNLTTTDPAVTIKDKNDTPFTKEISKLDETAVIGTDPVTGKDVQVGQKVTYQIKGKVPDLSGAGTYIYRAKDTMTAGLTFNKDVTVQINSTTVTLSTVTGSDTLTGNQIRYTDPAAGSGGTGAAGGGFELSLDLLEKNGNTNKYEEGNDIVITYSATVNKDAVNVISENKAELRYGTDPDDLAESTPQVVRTLSSKIVIDKCKKDNADTKLAGAKFVLKNGEGKYYKGTFSGDAENVEPENLTKVEWIAAGADGAVPVDGDGNITVTVVTTDTNGAAAFAGLANGTYYLVEVEAPAGYHLLGEAVEVKINAELDLTATPPSLKTGDGFTTQTVTATVENSDSSFLPSTGGIGTTVFYVLGTLLILAAAVWLLVRKRAEEKKE